MEVDKNGSFYTSLYKGTSEEVTCAAVQILPSYGGGKRLH